MALLNRIFQVVNGMFPAEVAHAHCDIPCGIYDPIAAKIAAQTVQKMVVRIQALQQPAADANTGERASYVNTLSRYIQVKEEHAQLCKKELSILWTDYFRPDHLENHPDLHSHFWTAEKLAGRNKQTVDLDAAKELVSAVDEIAEIFWSTKGVQYKDEVAEARFGT